MSNNIFHDVGGPQQFDLGAATVSSEWSTGPADARNGLYWLWNPSWDQLYSGVVAPPDTTW